MRLAALPYVMLTALLFGSTLIASRFSVGQFHPLIYISIRLILASLAFVVLFRSSPRFHFPHDRTIWLKAGILGVFGTALNLLMIVNSLQYLSSGIVSLLLTLSPVLTVLLAAVFLPEERLNVRQWLGIGLVFTGAALLTLSGENGLPDVTETNPLGYVLISVAIIAGSIMTIYIRRVLKDCDSTQVASIRIFIAMLVVVPLGLAFGEQDASQINAAGIFAVVYAGLVGTFGGFFSQLYTVQRFGAVPGAMITYFIPIVAGIGGVLVLGESITTPMLISFVIIVAGIVLVQRREKRVVVTA